MSFAYRARFDTTHLPLPTILAKLNVVFDELGIRFQGRVARVIPHEGGGPTIDMSELEPVPVQGLEEAGRAAEHWWGLALECISLPLMHRLGRGDWTEVDFTLFHAANGHWTLQYEESSKVQDHRVDEEEAARDFYELQLRLCAALGFKLSIYDEENDDLPPFATLEDIEQRLKRCAEGLLGCSITVSSTLMNLQRARELVGPQAELVRLSTVGHILFPFLTPDTDDDE